MEKGLKCSVCGKERGSYAVPMEYYHLLENRWEDKPADDYVCHKCAMKADGVKKLYHISNSCNIIDEFIPRIPYSRASEEDNTTPRVSLSSSIEGCLTAVPWGNSRLEQIFWEDGSFLIRVYEFEISKLDCGKLITPDYLYFSDSVRDAYATKEYWYLDTITPSKTYLIELTDYTEDSEGWVACSDMLAYLKAAKNGEETDEDYEEIASSWFSLIEKATFKKVPESRRSRVFRLNHRIRGVTLKDAASVMVDFTAMYPTERTWVDLRERDGKIYAVGEVDTRCLGSTNCSGEIDTKKMSKYFNDNLRKGKIVGKECVVNAESRN